jgi:hypothetical protein
MVNGELRGVIHGRTIVLDEEPGLPDGAAVAVRVSEASETLTDEERLERLKRAAGAWKDEDEAELDEFIKWTYDQRKIDRPEISE